MASPLQVCMETSDWLKAIVPEDCGVGMDSSTTSPSGDMISCLRQPVIERRLRPPHDQPLKCPRCDSTHTKFCYYNNYSLSQPRYFCKTCRRYWTKGGSLRNVPVGGGCRKNKRPSSSKKPQPAAADHQHRPTDLHLSFAGGEAAAPNNLSFMLDGQENKFGAMLGVGSRSHLFVGGGEVGLGELGHGFGSPNGFNSGLGPIGFDGGHMAFAEACQRLSMPFDGPEEGKPSGRMLSLEWPEPGCGADSFGYSSGLGLWAGMVNGHGSSAAM